MSDPGPGPTLCWTVGDVRITRVGELIAVVPRQVLLPDVTAEHLRDNADWLAPYFTKGRLNLAFQTFVVQSGDTTIVVDTCLGDDPIRRVPGDPAFPARLAAEVDGGLDAVDVVLCTHLHFDHVGWNTRIIGGQRVPTFANARYLFGRDELDHLDDEDHDDIRGADVQPLLDAGLADLVETDHRITPEVRCIPTTGHTPGHVSVLIESGDRTALITGDAFHSPVQFRHPEIAAVAFDWDSDLSTATRRALVADHVDTDVLVLGTHFAPPTAGHLRRGDAGVWFESLEPSEDLRE